MDSTSLKWLIAGLAGAMMTLCLLGAGAYMAVRFLQAELAGFSNADPIYGPDQWHENEAEHLAEEAEEDAELAASGLLDRYTIVDIHGDTRQLLYGQRDFAAVEESLAAQFENADTPLDKHRYSQQIRYLGEFHYGEDPEERWNTLTEWVDSRPDAYHARLVRGAYAIRYAWYYRGNTYSNQVTNEGWDGFHRYLDIARDDLESASAMNPADPEPTAFLITVSSAQGGGRQEIERYYEETLAINPLHYNARSSKLNFVQPKWGGSWEDIEAIIADCRAHLDEFPLLVNIIRDGEHYMQERGEAYEGTWDSSETKQMLYEAYRAQALAAPDDLWVQMDFSFFAADLRHFDEAHEAMERVGDRFAKHRRFSNLSHYNLWRGICAAEYSQYPSVVSTPREREILEAAVVLDPHNTVANTIYLGFLAREQDEAGTRAFHDSLEDAYLDTGDWGDPPDFTVMEAMAKAGRSDDFGQADTDTEKPLLDAGFALAPENAFVRLVYAEYHITRRDFDAAEIHLTRAREIDPDYLPALHIMGWLHFHQKRWDEAIETANEFLATEPSAYLEENTSDAYEIIELCEEKKREGL